MNKQKEIISICLNIVIIILEIIGLILNLKSDGVRCLFNYSQINNLMLMVVSFGTAYFSFLYVRKNKEIPYFVRLSKYIVTTMVVITFIDQAFLLNIATGLDDFGYFLFRGSALFLHTLCPLLALISLLAFERVTLDKWAHLIALIPTLVYGVILLFLNIIKVVEGPYGFFLVHETPFKVIAVWLIALVVVCYVICLLIKELNNLIIKLLQKQKNKLNKR